MEYKNLDMRDTSLQEDALRKIWHDEYCTQSIFTFDGIRVHFYDDNFDHAFYESSTRNYQNKSKENGYKDCLSAARLEKMLWIKDVLMDKDAELYCGYDKKTASYKKSTRVSVVKGDYGSVCKLGDLTILCIKFSHSEEEESDIIYTSERGPKPF